MHVKQISKHSSENWERHQFASRCYGCQGLFLHGGKLGKPSEMAVAAAVLNDSNGSIIVAVSQHFPQLDVNVGEAHTALLLAVNLACSYGFNTLHLECDSLIIILSNKVITFYDWNFAPTIGDIQQRFQFFQNWTASKTFCTANFRVHD